MLQYLPTIVQCTKKVRHTLNKHAQYLLQDIQSVSDYFGALRNKGLTLKHENVLRWLDNDFVLSGIKTAYVNCIYFNSS